ncbi:uncharacterized protein LOC117287767 [Asterias rubens]|uniref:uncharacterized protein LOC117287767 n=1 Tax=Asterias rubens TaxID=7604 RepID=UPI0014556CCF|nr:uncharacterized protein LOC117287767 [Asterias rubens]XP_033624173.1 uncharacterized protein LOC117287767 [Asterias rubens]
MMKAAQNRREKFFRKLSKGLKNDWEEVASHCGIPHEEIENIKASTCNPHLHEKSFQFLVKLWEKFPHLEDWSGKLLQALGTAERMDLVEQLQGFRLNEKTIQDTMDEGSLDSEPSLTSSSSQKGLPGDSSVPENSKRSENEGILKTASQNGNAKPEGSVATKTTPKRKRKLSKDAKENGAGPHSSPKKRTKPSTTKPVKPPKGGLKKIKDICEEGSHTWYIKAWLDHWCKKEYKKGPVKGPNKFHCSFFLRDKSEETIYTSIFCNNKKECKSLWRYIKGCSKKKPLYIRRLNVKKEDIPKYLNVPGKSNCKLILNEHSEVTKA